MARVIVLLIIGMALVLSGLMAGFFWAWDVSVMYGLAQAEPRVAVPAMQAINANIRNIPFAMGYFGTELVLVVAAVLAMVSRLGAWSTGSLVAAAVIYGFGVIGVTSTRSGPLNQVLQALQVDVVTGANFWGAYAQPWLAWNRLRLVAAILVLALTASSLLTGAMQVASRQSSRRRSRSR